MSVEVTQADIDCADAIAALYGWSRASDAARERVARHRIEAKRAALTALLEGLEPVAFIGRSPSGKLEELTCRSGNLDADELAVGWTETPLYDLSDVRGEIGL